MAMDSPFAAATSYRPADVVAYHGARLPADFGAPADEYRAARDSGAVFDRSERGLLVLTGKDCAAWLHNLVTNAVKTLEPYTGNYAFAVDVKGRTQFDVNVLVLPDRIWLDLDGSALQVAVAHLNRFLITEDAQICDESAKYARLGCAGADSNRIAAALGVSNFKALAALSSVAVHDEHMLLFRHDFAGTEGFELILPVERAAALWERVVQSGARPAGFHVLDALRCEAGIPWFGRDIDEQVVPPETGQVERGISYHKGCYLGQEVIERMRARGVLARRLVKLRMGVGADLPLPAELHAGESIVGRITSLVKHPTNVGRVGLGYLKSSAGDTANLVAGAPPQAIELLR